MSSQKSCDSEASHDQITTTGPPSRCSPPVEFEPSNHPVPLPRVGLEIADHLLVGSANLAPKCPRHRVLDVEVAHLEGIGVAEGQPAGNCRGPRADTGDAHEGGCERRRGGGGRVWGKVMDQPLCVRGDLPQRVCPAAFDPEMVQVVVCNTAEAFRIRGQPKSWNGSGGEGSERVSEPHPLSRRFRARHSLAEHRRKQFVIRRIAPPESHRAPPPRCPLDRVMMKRQGGDRIGGAGQIECAIGEPSGARSMSLHADGVTRDAEGDGPRTLGRPGGPPERVLMPRSGGIVPGGKKRSQRDAVDLAFAV